MTDAANGIAFQRPATWTRWQPMNGESARLQIERPGSCAQIEADETISVRVPIGQPTPLSNVAVVACLRGPDLATTEVQVRAMLASATVRR